MRGVPESPLRRCCRVVLQVDDAEKQEQQDQDARHAEDPEKKRGHRYLLSTTDGAGGRVAGAAGSARDRVTVGCRPWARTPEKDRRFRGPPVRVGSRPFAVGSRPASRVRSTRDRNRPGGSRFPSEVPDHVLVFPPTATSSVSSRSTRTSGRRQGDRIGMWSPGRTSDGKRAVGSRSHWRRASCTPAGPRSGGRRSGYGGWVCSAGALAHSDDRGSGGGRYWTRTSGLMHVKHVL